MKNEKRLARDYMVPFTSLKLGSHRFKFEIKDAFFSLFDYSLLDQGSGSVSMELDKHETMMNLHFIVEGEVPSQCDRCGDPLTVQVQAEEEFVVKFGNPEETTDEILVLPESAYELDAAPLIYELFAVSVPAKRVHEDGACNEEVIERLEYADEEEEEDSDPRWDALKKLKNND